MSILLLVTGLISASKAVSLSSTYSSDTTLSASGTYTVDSDVTVYEGATLFIKNDVTITFTGPYTINVEGEIDIGCSDLDTTQSICNTPGVCYAMYVFITASSNSSNSMTTTGVVLVNNGNASICNTRFDGLTHGLKQDCCGNGWFEVDNAEFMNMEKGLDIYTYNYDNPIIVKDSRFSNIDYYGIYIPSGGALVDNCQFHTISSSGQAIYVGGVTNITNCQFTDNHGSNSSYGPTAVYYSAYGGYISNNIFSNWYRAVQVNSDLNITYNEFNNNAQAVYISF